ncbi:metallophosphoesterase [Microbacterium sp. NPDC057944]|uniref:metallophosphoesterase family protein n=1 Tax=Microbacterium sp. NPDC057944 TaxID=3346286 RepID=UPI0036DA82EE
MDALEHAPEITLPDQRVAVCGDWHGNVEWARTVARVLPFMTPDVTTLLHLGDWWMPPTETDDAFAETDIDRIFVTLGNHEPWDQISPMLDEHPGCAVRVSKLTWLLPRPARLTISGRRVLSLGGAASVDRQSRIEGLTWWPDEAITDEHVAAAIAGGPADLMLTHEGPAGTPVRPVREILRTNPHRFPATALEASATSRARIAEVWNAVRPELLAHGHMHVAVGGKAEDGRRVASLGREGHEGNLGILDMNTLKHSAAFDLTEMQAPQQAFDYGTEEWETFHDHARNTVESENQQLKASGDEDIATAGRRRVRGITAAQILVTHSSSTTISERSPRFSATRRSNEHERLRACTSSAAATASGRTGIRRPRATAISASPGAVERRHQRAHHLTNGISSRWHRCAPERPRSLTTPAGGTPGTLSATKGQSNAPENRARSCFTTRIARLGVRRIRI